jgi:S-DNA-T family DNA segregation ATPase FtsK/SpoIIIE
LSTRNPQANTSASKRGNGTGKSRAKQAASKSPAAKGTHAASAAKAAPVFDSRIKNDIAGVLIAVLAIAIFIAVLQPGEAILTKITSSFFHLGFGIGAYVLPFMLLIWGASFFVKQTFTKSPLRLGLGLVLIYISTLGLVAINTADAVAEPDLLFAELALTAHGGYVGAGIAWALLKLVGYGIAIVILAGLVVVGLVIIGFSITGLVERVAHKLGFGRSAEDEPQGAYGLPAKRRLSETSAGKGNKLLTPTARLDRRPGSEDGLYADAFDEGEQGRLPLPEGADTETTRRLNGKAAAGEANGDKTIRFADGDPGAAANSADAVAAAAAPNPLYSDFKLPDPAILQVSKSKATTKAGANELRETAARLQATLDEFAVDGQVTGWIAGPTVTLFKLSLDAGVRLNKILNLQNDIALALAAPAVRIMAPIPGTSLVGIEVPNTIRNTVLLGDVLHEAPNTPLQLAIGKDVEGDAIIADLAKMPHLLIGGTTGSGKSVAINAMIMSMLMRATPAQVRMILIDPKRVELSLYNGIPHLYVPVVTDPQKAASALAWAVIEMERRLKLFEKSGVRNVNQFNGRVREHLAQLAEQAEAGDNAAGRASVSAGKTQKLTAEKTAEDEFNEELPFIVVVIDELADLMMVAGKEVEASICRISQLARAAGIHLIVATQRPSTNVITGLIKANITNRIAFNVASGIDSRVILDSPGAENLVGLGDLLFSKPEYGKPVRIQGCYVSEKETQAVVDYLHSQGEPDYHEDILTLRVGGVASGVSLGGDDGGDDDPLIWEAAEIVVSSNLGSTSTLQRRLKVGYARAGRIMDMLEAKGVVGPPNGSKPREVLIDELELESLKAFEAGDSADGW